MENTATDIETHIKGQPEGLDVGDKKKVLIATLYNHEPVMLACTRLGPDRLILLVDRDSDKVVSASLSLIKEALGSVLDIKEVKIDPYDVVGVASKAVEIIDLQPKGEEIYLNITAGRKTMAIGLLFAGYVRHDQVKGIAYNPEEDPKAIVWLPRLSFKLTESQKMILEKIDSGKFINIKDLADKMEKDISTAMVYRAIDELRDMDLLEEKGELKLTDAGKIARL